ncbi:MAG: hypothetical protein U1E73_12160 [Planctomycetota bacterium]
MKFLASAALAAFAATASAQCGTLATTGTGAPGTALTIDLSGATPMAMAALAVGDTLGTTTINLGSFGSLTLGLAQPFIPLPLGRTDAAGAASRTINVPSTVTQGIDLNAQAVVLGISFGQGGLSLTFCATNVVSFHLGV